MGISRRARLESALTRVRQGLHPWARIRGGKPWGKTHGMTPEFVGSENRTALPLFHG